MKKEVVNASRIIHLCLAALLMAATGEMAYALDWTGRTFEGQLCKGRVQAFGPWDFFDVDEPTDENWQAGRWWEAKVVHARPGMAALNAKNFDQIEYNRAAHEFDYLLRAYPNHPNILGAVIQLELRRREAPKRIRPWQTPPECYLKRARSFRPRQPHIEQLMGFYLHRLRQFDEAIVYYQRAVDLDPEYSEAYYNMGLAYLELAEYDAALESAHAAYSRGFPLPGLRHRLQRANKWQPLPDSN